MKYTVKIWDEAFYPEVEADSPEEAERITLEYHATDIKEN